MVEDTNDGTFLAPPPAGRGGAPERRADRGRDLQLRACPSSRWRSARRPTRRCRKVADAPRPRAVHGADRDAGRLLRAPARRLPDGRLAGPRRRRRRAAPCTATRACTASTASIIPTSLGVNPSLTISAVSRALRRAAGRPRSRLRPAGQAGGLPARGAAGARRPQGGADGELARGPLAGLNLIRLA